MSRNIVATEEVLVTVVDMSRAHHARAATVRSVASDLAVSEATVRRHLRLLRERGWVQDFAPQYIGGRASCWLPTDVGREAHDTNRGF